MEIGSGKTHIPPLPTHLTHPIVGSCDKRRPASARADDVITATAPERGMAAFHPPPSAVITLCDVSR